MGFGCFWGTLLLMARQASAAPFCEVVLPPAPAPLVRQAATELSAYLSRLSGSTVPVVEATRAGRPSVVLSPTMDDPTVGEEEYFIEPGPGPSTVTIRARTPLGVLHGAYCLLREYGIGFYFDGDAIPSEPPERFLTPTLHGSPVFAVRGSLPWYNFFNSPTAWDDQDFRFLADQIVRSGQNFIGFHTYDNEPFAAYEWDGALAGGEPLLTTADYVWGTRPLPVDEFGFGTGRFFLGRFWGSDAARQEGPREERIGAQKALLARGLAYASARGVRTCLGFEVSGDPTDPAEQRRFRARLRQLLLDYPMLDYVWLWQPEARSLEGTPPPALRSQGGRLFRGWESAFAPIGSTARMWEGMRVAGYGHLGQALIDGTAPSVKLVLSGWGGDHHLRVSDYFPAWDKVLDRRIIFAALDDIVVGPKVSRYYELPADRERWTIPWYEFDGDQWFPQANAHVFADTVRDARAKGCQGLLAIHWRTKEVGESQALCAQYAWHPDETLEGFYRDYAIRRVGPQQGRAFGALLQELDGLGYRWLGGAGQAECGTFAWCHVSDPAREQTLRELKGKLEALRTGLMTTGAPAPPAGAFGRVEDVIATLDRALLFNRVAGLLVAGGPVDRALALPPGDGKTAECRRLMNELAGPDFGEMLNLYAQTTTSRGELGVLATVNGKAFVDLRDKAGALREACGEAVDVSDLSRPDPAHQGIVSDYQLSSVAAGTDLPVRCVAYNGAEAARKVTLEYGTPARPEWTRAPMRLLERSTFEGTIPAEAVQPGWVRYRLIADLPEGRANWPAVRGEPYRQVTVFPAEALAPRRNAVDGASPQLAAEVRLQAEARPDGRVALAWTPGGRLPEVTVERKVAGADWTPLGATVESTWEDAAAPPSAELEYRLVDTSGAAVASCAAHTPPPPAPSVPRTLVARARGTAVRLWWSGADVTVSRYTVERADEAAGPFVTVSPEAGLEPSGFTATAFVDRPRRDGEVFYRIRALGADPETSAVSEVVSAQTLSRVPAPRLNLEFRGEGLSAPTGPLDFSGPHTFVETDGRTVLRTEGGLAVPYGEAVAVNGPFTIAIRFRQTERTPIPVLVCQGAWLGPGYFVQLMGDALRFYVGGAGCLDRRVGVPLGEWHTVVCAYDGRVLTAYLDGVLLGEQEGEGPLTPAMLPLTVARYSSIGPEWTFKGEVDFVRLYDHALEPWMTLRADPASEPALDVNWTSADVTAGGRRAVWHQEPAVVDTEHGRAADLKGGLTVPFGDLLAVGESLTLETSFLLRSVEGMPVLVNQGLWPGEGYMLQVLGRRIRFHVGGVGSLDCGPEIGPDRWHDVRCTYDGATLRVYLDGAPIGELAAAGMMNPSIRPLRLGRYETDQPVYVVDGLLGRTRVYAASE